MLKFVDVVWVKQREEWVGCTIFIGWQYQSTRYVFDYFASDIKLGSKSGSEFVFMQPYVTPKVCFRGLVRTFEWLGLGDSDAISPSHPHIYP